MNQKMDNYQKDIALCTARIKEVFKEAKVEKLKDVEIKEKSNLSYDMPTEYDIKTHTIYVDREKLETMDDTANALMHGVLEAITTDEKTAKQGVYFENKFESINKGITHMISNLLIPSENYMDSLFSSYIISNILTHLAGADIVFDSYFNSNGEKMYNKLLEKLGNDKTYLDTMAKFSDIEAKSLNERNYPSLLPYIQDSITHMYIKNNDLSKQDIKNYYKVLFTDPNLAPDSQKNRLFSCRGSNEFFEEELRKAQNQNNHKKKDNDKELMSMFDDKTDIRPNDYQGRK